MLVHPVWVNLEAVRASVPVEAVGDLGSLLMLLKKPEWGEGVE